MDNRYFCYILRNHHLPHINRTYNGFTVNPKRRIRQHNQEIKGGAKYTRIFGNRSWEMYVLISGFPNDINALQCEWRIKHPNNRRKCCRKYCTPTGRIIGLNNILKLPQWTRNSTVLNNTLDLHVWILQDFAHLLTNLPEYVTLHVVDDINLDILNPLDPPDI